MKRGFPPIWKEMRYNVAVSAQEIENLILKNLPDAQVRIEDLRGDGDHYAAYVTSPSFSGKSRVIQHKMVYQALEGLMDEDLHALMLHTISE